MKIISKKTRQNGEPLFVLEKTPEPNSRNEFILTEYYYSVPVILTKTKKGYELEFFLADKFIKTFISNAEIIEV